MTEEKIRIRAMENSDADAVLAIYAEGVADGNATFECEAPDWARFDAARLSDPRVVLEEDGVVCGWAVLSSVSQRAVYRGVAEVTLYLAGAVRGRGLGVKLLSAMVDAAEEAGFWMLQAVIFPENEASLRLHERAGFRVVGRRERIALMQCGPYQDEWRDTLLLERRSSVTG